VTGPGLAEAIAAKRGRRLKDDDGDGQRAKILLEGKISIDRDEHVEFLRRQREQFPILDRSPAHPAGGHDLMTYQVAREPPIDAFVEENPHVTDSTSRSFAASRNSMTCARPTDGKPARNSSIESPASR
jgi:hypothetical protein